MTLKRLTMSRTPEDVATRDLYRIIFTDEENTRYEDVKDCIDRGAKLVGIEASYGIPLLFAMRCGCDSSIIKLLVDSGGCDLSYRSFEKDEFDIAEDISTSDTDEDDTHFLRIYSHYIRYMSIQNELIRMYHTSIGSPKLENKILKELATQGCCVRKNDLPYILKDIPDSYEPVRPVLYEYTKQCCELVGISFESLKNADEELVPITDIHAYHFIPKDTQPYTWNYRLDIYNPLNHIEDSSDDENE